MASHLPPPGPRLPPKRNKGLITGPIKGNQWLYNKFINHDLNEMSFFFAIFVGNVGRSFEKTLRVFMVEV